MIAFCDCDCPLSDCRGWCKNCGDRLGEDERDKEMRDVRTRLAELEAERDAAKAGAARAVEALRKIRGEDIQPDADGLIEDVTCCYCEGNSAEGCDEDCPRFIAYEALDGSQPALDWLAQREREAIVRELTQLGPLGSRNPELFMVPWSEIKRRIAALTTQQPTACSRSEVRGKENNNA
jgi:hypothetical protein